MIQVANDLIYNTLLSVRDFNFTFGIDIIWNTTKINDWREKKPFDIQNFHDLHYIFSVLESVSDSIYCGNIL